MTADSYTALGAYLTSYEAERLASAYRAGDSTTQALRELHPSRRADARDKLTAADLGPARLEVTLAVLAATAGARGVRTDISPVWTMPGTEATTGRLTAEVRRIVDQARMSVVCSSFNFTPHSWMWQALRAASTRADVTVTVYVDATAGSPAAVAAHLPRAAVYRTQALPGEHAPLVSHAKFLIVDRALTLLTSANFSHNAEHNNIELGLLIHDATLAAAIETQMRSKHGILYELVTAK